MATRKEGSIFEIRLSNGKYSYGRILAKADYAFYDIYKDKQITEINDIVKSNVLFIVAVYKDAITKERWKKVGYIDLEPTLKILPSKFIEDALNPDHYELYDPNTGEIRPVDKQRCVGLERSAVWEPQHVEERLIDYYEGRQNKWVEQLKVK
jgi:hypothetical protein